MDITRDCTIFCPSYNTFTDAETFNFDSDQYLSSSEIPLYNHALEEVYPDLFCEVDLSMPDFKEIDNHILENAKGNNHTNVTMCPSTSVVKTEVHNVYDTPPKTSLEVTLKQEKKTFDDSLLDDVDDFNIMDYINGTDSTTFATTSFKNKAKSQKSSKKKGTTSKKKTVPPEPKIRAGYKKIDIKAQKYIVDKVAEVRPSEHMSNLKTEDKPNKNLSDLKDRPKEFNLEECTKNDADIKIIPQNIPDPKDLALEASDINTLLLAFEAKSEASDFSDINSTKNPLISCSPCFIDENSEKQKDISSFGSAPSSDNFEIKLDELTLHPSDDDYADIRNRNIDFNSIPLFENVTYPAENSGTAGDILSNYMKKESNTDNLSVKLEHLVETEIKLEEPTSFYPSINAVLNPIDSETTVEPAEDIHISQSFDNVVIGNDNASFSTFDINSIPQTVSCKDEQMIAQLLDFHVKSEIKTKQDETLDFHVKSKIKTKRDETLDSHVKSEIKTKRDETLDFHVKSKIKTKRDETLDSHVKSGIKTKRDETLDFHVKSKIKTKRDETLDFHVKSEVRTKRDETLRQAGKVLQNINSDLTIKQNAYEHPKPSESAASVVVTTANNIKQVQIISDVAGKLALEAHFKENTNINKLEILPTHVKIENCPKSSPLDKSSGNSSLHKHRNALVDHTYAMKSFECEKVRNVIATEQPVCDRISVSVLKQDTEIDSNVSQKKRLNLEEYYRKKGKAPKANSLPENNEDSSSLKKEVSTASSLKKDSTVSWTKNQQMMKEILTIKPKSQSETEESKTVALPNKAPSIHPQESKNLRMMKNKEIAQQPSKPEAVLKTKMFKPVPISNQAFKIQRNASLTNVNNSMSRVRPLRNDNCKLYALSNKIPKSQISSSPNSLCSSSSQERAEPKWVTFWDEETKSFMKVEAALSTKTLSSSPNSTGSISPQEAGRKFLQLWNSESRSLLKGQVVNNRTTHTGPSSNIPSRNAHTNTQNQKIHQNIQEANKCLNAVPQSSGAFRVVSISTLPKAVDSVPQNHTSIQDIIQKAIKSGSSKEIQKPITKVNSTSNLLPESKSKVESSSLKASPRMNTECMTLYCVGVNTDPITLEDIGHINSVTPVFQGKPITHHSLFSSILENVEQKPKKHIDRPAVAVQKEEIVMYVPEVRDPQTFKETATQTDLDLIVATKKTIQIKEQLRQSLIKSPVSSSSRTYCRLKRKRSISSSSTDSSSSESSRKRHSSSSSSSKTSSSTYSRRRRSPSSRGYTSSDSSGSHSRTRSRSRSRHQTHGRRHSPDFKEDAERRCVVFIGNIRNSERIHEEDLRRRFQRFGAIKKTSLHRKNREYSYGFVTFYNREDAVAAIDHGNDDPTLPKYTLSFGGRRIFCQTYYSDLDNMREQMLLNRPPRPRHDDVDFSEMLSEYAYKRKLLTK